MESKKSKKTFIFAILGIVAIIILILFLLKGCTKEKEYTVIFDSDGGSAVESVTVKENETVPKPADPIKEGYQFIGWYLGEELFDFDTKITKDITLKANWDINGIKLSATDLNLVVGSEEKLEIISLPEGTNKEDFLYSSSDESIVMVDANGNLKALKAGKVTITVKSKDGKYTETCTVTVMEEEIKVESVSISGSSSVTVGSSIKLSVTLKPSNATTPKLTWKSSDSKIATVDGNGVVKGIKTGKVTITVTTENGKTATKEITVKAKATATPKPTNSPSPTPSQEPEPTTTPTPEPKYIIYLTKRELAVVGGAIQYDFRVEKDGVEFTDYLGFTYNNTPVSRGQGSVSSTTVANGGDTATLKLSSGEVVTASVVIN